MSMGMEANIIRYSTPEFAGDQETTPAVRDLAALRARRLMPGSRSAMVDLRQTSPRAMAQVELAAGLVPDAAVAAWTRPSRAGLKFSSVKPCFATPLRWAPSEPTSGPSCTFWKNKTSISNTARRLAELAFLGGQTVRAACHQLGAALNRPGRRPSLPPERECRADGHAFASSSVSRYGHALDV